MSGLVPGIHVFLHAQQEGVDGRDEPGHDECYKSTTT
jgi:hydroxymethylglutaryl-CoA lyase